MYIKTSDESLKNFANYTPLMYLASKKDKLNYYELEF
jgi:hypothetical protein